MTDSNKTALHRASAATSQDRLVGTQRDINGPLGTDGESFTPEVIIAACQAVMDTVETSCRSYGASELSDLLLTAGRAINRTGGVSALEEPRLAPDQACEQPSESGASVPDGSVQEPTATPMAASSMAARPEESFKPPAQELLLPFPAAPRKPERDPRLGPAVPIEDSVHPDYLISLEDGREMRLLSRYLRNTYGLTPERYRKKWGLPDDYPMVAPNLTRLRAKTRADANKDFKRGTDKGPRFPRRRRADAPP